MKEPKVKSLYRAMKILECFTPEEPELGITELSERTGMLKSSIHNVVTTFELLGYIEKDTKNAKYRLGSKILELSYVFSSFTDYRRTITPYLHEICRLTENNVFLAIFADYEIVYLEGVNTPGAVIRNANMTGRRDPPHCTALGKVLMANLSEEKQHYIISHGLKEFTEHTITNSEELLKELKAIKKQGYAIDNMEHEYGIKCVAVPIYNIYNEVRFAVSVSGPSLRFTNKDIKHYIDILKNKAEIVKKAITV